MDFEIITYDETPIDKGVDTESHRKMGWQDGTGNTRKRDIATLFVTSSSCGGYTPGPRINTKKASAPLLAVKEKKTWIKDVCDKSLKL